MTITRIINGELITIKLDSIELRNAAKEFEHFCYVDDVKEHIRCNSIEMTSEQIDDAATRIDSILAWYDGYWDYYWSAVDEAIEEVRQDDETVEEE